jgi:hypothetical protein
LEIPKKLAPLSDPPAKKDMEVLHAPGRLRLNLIPKRMVKSYEFSSPLDGPLEAAFIAAGECATTPARRGCPAQPICICEGSGASPGFAIWREFFLDTPPKPKPGQRTGAASKPRARRKEPRPRRLHMKRLCMACYLRLDFCEPGIPKGGGELFDLSKSD